MTGDKSLAQNLHQMENNFILLEEADSYFKNNPKYPLSEEVYSIIGACMEVHNYLGKGFLEIVYKDALEIEFNSRGIPYEREKCFEVYYKGIKLNREFYSDFFCYNAIVLEAKAQEGVVEAFYKQIINFLCPSFQPLGLVVNFGEDSLKFKRIILSKTNTKL